MSGYGIFAFVGPNGGGKTLAMVELLALPALAEGRRVLSNFELVDDAGNPHPLWDPLTSWGDLIEAYDTVVLLDEITSVLPSREAMRAPAQLISRTNQLRKNKLTLGWSAPAWARADTALREVTQVVWVCRGRLADRWQRVEDGKTHHFPFSGSRGEPAPRMWRPHRLMRWEAFDAISMDEFSYGRVERSKIKRVDGRWYWRPGHVAHRRYRTMDQVALLDHLDETGVCIHCHGRRTRPTCKCPVPTRPARGVEEVPSA